MSKSISKKSLANLALGPKSKKKSYERKKSLIALSRPHRELLKQLGNGKLTAGAELLPEMVRLLQDCYAHVPDDLSDRIEALGIIKACEEMPEEYVVRDDNGDVIAWIV